MQHVLVTGGAGYIGSHACKSLRAAGFVPVTFDNLRTGWRDAVKFGPFEHGDILDRARLNDVFTAYQPLAVMHFAALSLVGESMSAPELYWRNNVVGSLNLIEAAVEAGCKRFVFSSTCATYGEHDNVVLDESTPQHPINAYGASKKTIESMLQNFQSAHGLGHVIFRYFNVAGADPEAEIGELHQPETHLIPLIFDTLLGKTQALTVNGTDYPTPDGTCIRDYVHVCDLIDAHVLGLKWLLKGNESQVFNLGTGKGFSVKEVIDCSRQITNRALPLVKGPRRPGDCARLVSGSERARKKLGWIPLQSTMPQMIKDAWAWHQSERYLQ
ncbi:MAG: UDP-glucose 4-epimerase GalE [Pseudomonadota bacterium]